MRIQIRDGEQWNHQIDFVGLTVAVVFAGWIVLAATAGSGDPLPMAGLVLAVVGAVIVAHRLATIHPLVVPSLVAASPVFALMVRPSSPPAQNILGYANASGALFFVAACAALTIGISVRGAVPRTVAYLVAATWILVPWSLGADAAAILATLLPVAFVIFRQPKRVRALPLLGGGLTLSALLACAFLGAVDYRPSEGANLLDRWFHENLDEVRVVLWGEAVDLVREHPITGVGPGNLEQFSPTAGSDEDLRWTHNEYLQVAAETGLPGGLLLVALIAWGFFRLWSSPTHPRSVPAIVALAGVGLHANIDYVWHFPPVPLALGLLVGSASAAAAPLRPEVDEAPPSTQGVPLATVALWLLLLAPIPSSNPVATARNGARWMNAEPGIRFVAPGLVRSTDPPSELVASFVANEAFSIEVIATPHLLDQGGPARLVSVSRGISARNFTLGQEGHSLIFRMRTTQTSDNGIPQLEVPSVFTSTDPRHIIVSADPRTIRVYVDGTPTWTGPGPGGSMTNWDRTFPLILGNETSVDRPWIGELELVALYDEALEPEEVARKYPSAGSSASRGSSLDPAPAAWYGFEGSAGPTVRDRSPTGLGPVLVIPDRILTTRDSPVDTILDAGGSSISRLLTHAVLFGVWAFVVFWITRPWATLWIPVPLVIGGGVVIALAASTVRYLGGRSPSLWDLLGAGVGCTVATLAYYLSEHRPFSTENASDGQVESDVGQELSGSE